MFYYFKRSGNRTAELKEIQKILDSDCLKVKEVHEIRWLAFHDALLVVHKSWIPLLHYFKAHRKNSQTASYLYDKLRDYRFIACTKMLMDIVPSLAQLSLIFQKKNLDVTAITPALSATLEKIKKVKSGKSHYQREFGEALSVTEEGKKGEYKGQVLKFKHADFKKSLTEFSDIRKEFLSNLEGNLNKRFPSNSKSIVKSFEVLGLRALSLLSPDEQDIYGNTDIKTLANFYGQDAQKKDTKSKAKLNGEACESEWTLLKRVVLEQKYPRDRMATLWRFIHTHHKDTFPNLLKLCEIGLVLPMHTADCERGFSSQNRIKSPSRNRLQAKMLNDLMMINIEGPDIEEFDFAVAVNKWCAKRERRAFKSCN